MSNYNPNGFSFHPNWPPDHPSNQQGQGDPAAQAQAYAHYRQWAQYYAAMNHQASYSSANAAPSHQVGFTPINGALRPFAPQGQQSYPFFSQAFPPMGYYPQQATNNLSPGSMPERPNSSVESHAHSAPAFDPVAGQANPDIALNALSKGARKRANKAAKRAELARQKEEENKLREAVNAGDKPHPELPVESNGQVKSEGMVQPSAAVQPAAQTKYDHL